MNKNIPPNFLFPTNFRNKRNVKRLIKDFYIQGYGIAVYLLEILAETEGHKYPLNDIDLIADELKISIPTLQEIIKSYGLFKIIEEGAKSGKYNIHIQGIYLRRQRSNIYIKDISNG